VSRVVLPAGIEDDETWAQLRGLYDAGRDAEVADRGRELIAANPDDVRLLYNIACCESLAGRTAEAIEHLRLVVDQAPERARSLAAEDSGLDPIRNQPAFRELIG
jgi:adenylate cyclase